MKFDLTQIRSAVESYKSNGLAQYASELPGFGGMSNGQREFHENQYQRRLLIAGNQIGKTRALAAEVWWHALGNHPLRPVAEPPVLGWVMW